MDNKNQDISMFVSFCIEQYKNEKQLSGEQAMRYLDKYGVLSYLAQHYEVLHTQGHRWILRDIDEYINIRKKAEVNA
jgi:chaperone required for assembly of F1-ATPase